MRKIQLWRVNFYPEGILQGTVDVAADVAEEAIQLAREAVSHPSFELRGLAPVLDSDGEAVFILWTDEPQVEGVETHNGKRYVPAAMPRPEDVDVEPRTGGQMADHGSSITEDNGTAPRQAVDTSVEVEAAKIIKESREDVEKRAAAGELNPWPKPPEKKDGH